MAGLFDTEVLVVHCVDTEGPIGGDVRRNPDGSKEFMDNWEDISESLDEITSHEFRNENRDSAGYRYKYNWFIMDFMGFKTNPKNRVQAYHDTYDHIKALNTAEDAFEWHYHHPNAEGVGDQWSDDWRTSQEYLQILGRRLLERNDFPSVYRAGGTIEDNRCSHWLEENMMIDYSNRASDQSFETDNIFDFNWYGAPDHWGYYHPSWKDFTKPGNMDRYIVRCVDLKSRLHELSQEDVNLAFFEAKFFKRPVILSYFSHDHRDMREETRHAISMIKKASAEYGVRFRWSSAVNALSRAASLYPMPGIQSALIDLKKTENDSVLINFSDFTYQERPFVFTLDKDNNVEYHGNVWINWTGNGFHTDSSAQHVGSARLKTSKRHSRIGVAAHAWSGHARWKVMDL